MAEGQDTPQKRPFWKLPLRQRMMLAETAALVVAGLVGGTMIVHVLAGELERALMSLGTALAFVIVNYAMRGWRVTMDRLYDLLQQALAVHFGTKTTEEGDVIPVARLYQGNRLIQEVSPELPEGIERRAEVKH